MSLTAIHFDRFVRRLHRRFILLRGVEWVGAGLLFGCGGAIVLMPILWWQGQSTFPVALLSLVISTFTGLVIAILRRPTPLDAVMEADGQLNLADLLSTAMLMRRAKNPSNDPWNATLLAIADAQCHQLSPSNVLLRRWTSRRWGGVGLAISLVLTLAAFFNASRRTQAETGPEPIFAPSDPLGAPEQISRSVKDTFAHRSPVRRPGHDPDDSSAESQSEPPHVTTDNDKADAFDSAAHKKNTPSASDPNGTGAGSTVTSGVKSMIPTPDTTSHNDRASRQGRTANGGQSANREDNLDTATTINNGLSGRKTELETTPPWHSPDWATDSQKAGDLIQSSPAYDPYRHLIRDYFDPRR